MAEFSSSEIAKLILDYLIEVRCYDAASIFQDTSPDLREFRELILQHETTASTLPRCTWGSCPPTINDMRLASILKKRSLPKNENATMERQLRRKRLTKDQKVILNQLFTHKSSLDDKINLASKFGITNIQLQSWYQRMQNIEKKKKNGRINLLEKRLKEVDSQLKELKQKKQSQTESKQVSFNTSNNPGPSTSQSFLQQNESFNFSNSDDSD